MHYKILLYRHMTYKAGDHPVMLQASLNGKVRRVSLGYTALPNQWNDGKSRFRKNVDNYIVKNQNIRKFELLAEKVIDDMILKGKVSLEIFMQKFKNKNSTQTVYEFFDEIVNELQAKGKVRNADTYNTAKKSLRKFAPNIGLVFSEIDYRFLKKYEAHLFERKVSPGGASVYMRTLRACYNEAIRRGLVDKSLYPFKGQLNPSGYSMAHLKSKKNPKALSSVDIEKIKSFDHAKYPHLSDTVNYFLFSFYTFGTNFTDIANLTSDNIYNCRLIYRRSKTGKLFNIKITERAHNILDYFAHNESDYLFPILSDFHQSEQQKKYRIKKVRKKVNTGLKEVAEILDIKVNLTFYVARHTMATTLKREGISTDIISEAMGHADVRTTKIYLKRFDSAVLDEAMAVLS